MAGNTAANPPQEFKPINIREQHPRDAAEVYRDYMDVGIRELRAHLSKYVRKAAGGEQIIVTDRGRPVARLVGLGTPMLERGIAEGWMAPPRRSGLTPAVYYRTALSTIDVIDEDRG